MKKTREIKKFFYYVVFVFLIFFATISLTACGDNVSNDALNNGSNATIENNSIDSEEYKYDNGIISKTETSTGGYVEGKWFSVDESDFIYNVNKGVASITGFNNEKHYTKIIVPSKLNTFPVQTINTGAFSNSATRETSMLSKIYICDGIIEILSTAFSGCNSAKSIRLPNSVTTISSNTFEGCESLVDFELPQSVTSLGDAVFFNCTSLKSVKMYDALTDTGESVFEGCNNLTSVTLSNGLSTINKSLFKNCISLSQLNLPKSITSIGASAFYGCKNLINIILPLNLTSIGVSAFNGCESLTRVEIPSAVNTIGGAAFFNCTNLAKVKLNNTSGWVINGASYGDRPSNFSDEESVANYLKNKNKGYTWTRNS